MIKPLADIPLSFTFCCTELNDKRILVTGTAFIKVFSLETYVLVADIPSDDYNWDSLMTPDNKNVFIATNKGLRQYSLPEFDLVKVHGPLSHGRCLHHLKSRTSILFNDRNRLLSLDLSTSIISRSTDQHGIYINSIASSPDEEFVFTTALDERLKQWRTDSLSVVKSVDLESVAKCLLVKNETGSILVGMHSGSISEYSINGLSYLRTVKVHKFWVSKIIQLSSGDVLTCSVDRTICLPFGDKIPIQVSEKEVISIVELRDKTIACCCSDGLKIVSPSMLDILLIARIDSISSSLESIRKSTSSQKPQLIALLQHHLVQLLNPVQHQPEKFTGLSLSLLPDLKSIQRSHCHTGSSEGRKRILTQNYLLEMIQAKSTISDSQAIQTFFDRKLKLLGKLKNNNDPLTSLKIEQMRRGKWVFSIHDQIDMNYIEGLATVHFLNGYLNCYVSEGYLTHRLGSQTTLRINGVIKEVISIGNDGIVFTSDQQRYFMNLDTNTIDETL